MDVDAMIVTARAGVGTAQVLASGMEASIGRSDIVGLFPDLSGETFPLYVVRPSRRLSSATADAFLDFCRDVCASSDAER